MKKKLVSTVLTALLVMGITPVSASAEWRSDSTGWWYSQGNSYVKGWNEINYKWYYFDNNGYMKTGWLKSSGNWYYLKSSGEMAKGTVIDGYIINNDWVWITNYKYNVDEAKKIMLKEDGEYVNKILSKNNEIVLGDVGIQQALKNNYKIDEEVYGFYINSKGEDPVVVAVEFVGINTGNVYRTGSNGGSGNTVKLIKDNKIVKEYTWVN